MEKFLPHRYRALSEGLASALPNTLNNALHPYTSMAINVNAETPVHRDHRDHLGCGVTPFGVFTGGAFVLWELGIIIELDPFDIVNFPSDLISHFNEAVKGERGSVVLFSDGAAARYHLDFNGWWPFVKHGKQEDGS